MPIKVNLPLIESKNKGNGLPFAIVKHQELINSKEIFYPTLRDFHVIFWFKKGSGLPTKSRTYFLRPMPLDLIY